MPDLRSVEAWQEPASRKQAATAVTTVLAIVQPDVTDEQAATVAELVVRRGYTQAELAYVVRELPYDPVLDKKLQFDGQVTAADFERWISEFRRLRKQLALSLRLEDVNRLIERHPNWLSWEDFGICSYTAAETPLYRYCYSGVIQDRTPNPRPETDEDPGADRDDEGGSYSIGELVRDNTEATK